jgi:hypothetical protein
LKLRAAQAEFGACDALADADELRSEPLLGAAAAVDVVAEACAGSGSAVVAEFDAVIATRVPRYEALGIYINRTAVTPSQAMGQEAQGLTKLKPKPMEKDNRWSVAEYPVTQGIDREELMDAIPSWTPSGG